MINLVKVINQFTGEDIERQAAMKMLINAEFDQTVDSLRLDIILYTLFYIIPFFIQIFQHRSFEVIFCITICLLQQLSVLAAEIKQMKQSGLKNHFKYALNIFELFQCIVFIVYYCVRVNDTDYVIPIMSIN